ncbi:tyrosine-type recombinase/integrase [Erwinia persicina]|uniref:phage integrase n=1 Tax=Erwinia persicina TaxID=55211 RepID=UPI001654A998|nr:tyrosine-type recombinase/integrase [Erwinia persicina]MBC3946661.1 tyrosine-type recombinase/integrase [Erwinia persicina]
MSVRKNNDGKWLCECYPSGREGRRVRKQFSTKGEAVAFEKHIMSEVDNKPWLGEKEDNRSLSEIIELWYNVHGVTLTGGIARRRCLSVVCESLGNPVASSITGEDLSEHRRKRLNGEVYREKSNRYLKPASLRSINLECTALVAVFNKLKKLKHIKYPNPISELEPFRVKQSELSFLRANEVVSLLTACEAYDNPDLTAVVKICLSTGCRWNEAALMNGSQVIPYKITFTRTKSGKNRTVPITKELYDSIPKKQGRLFENVYKRFKSVLRMAGIELPKNQFTHVLRHTFASHFMMNGGNILVLKEILGHSEINMTMIYAHFSPSHLEDAATKNPVVAPCG